jgi:hypothetical protein
MKKYIFYLLLFFLPLCLLYCTQETPEKSEILARINEYNLTLGEFQNDMAAELNLDTDFKLTKEAKKEFLEELIETELLIQEARKLKLDRKEKFRRTIERYWRSTLIRDLLQIKGKQISERVLISEEEIEAASPSLSEPKEKIIEYLKDKKKTRMLKEWLNEIRKSAKIEINQDLLYKN